MLLSGGEYPGQLIYKAWSYNLPRDQMPPKEQGWRYSLLLSRAHVLLIGKGFSGHLSAFKSCLQLPFCCYGKTFRPKKAT